MAWASYSNLTWAVSDAGGLDIKGIVFGIGPDEFEEFDVNSSPDERISQYLRHIPPILLVDKVLEPTPGFESKASLKLNEVELKGISRMKKMVR